ncbi:ATPases of the AAA+ class [Bathymodiolus heckerae thiotrophic gill symbiont]|uniref:ATPase n=1 Tax=Bathymodiolus heckerae thiotrophic gill symbiont TaxID=1052212 RepID=UPI0010B2E668|nr:ATPase [Bathymodiolus heckerae thiotrophic gill symbiont]CAC9452221.1 ATPases of the AAA+ class [uncultured Gammaproteobacteria bacterium]SMN12988.1 ATPases of the AAA+ class [Bathymodiolus heckerae thiotrophic gill symbiont]SMN14522.1 ATPases of the AAA+ class [uncultured Candidatus Thioglobus sp.]
MRLATRGFSKSGNKRLTLLGMSGVGKTHLSKLLSCDDKWYHYSGDYRIGAKYLNDSILDNIKQKIQQDECLAELLSNDSIRVENHITFDNLSSVSSFLGKVGNPEQGGLPIDEFMRRQALFQTAESMAMLDVPKFIEKSQQQEFNHFINDAGGSLCELDNEKVYKTLSENTLILYIRASKANESALIERAQTHPKPLYYQAKFLQEQLSIYLAKNQLTYVAQIDPDKFVRWIFPRLLEHRKPKYEYIAQQYGYTIDSEDLYQCKNADEVLELIYGAL